MKKLKAIALFAACSLTQSCDWIPSPPAEPTEPGAPGCEWDLSHPGIIGRALIHNPGPGNRTTAYPRLRMLSDSIFLASFTEGPVNGPGEYIVKFHKGYDLGKAWVHISDMHDTHRGLGCHEPEPFILPDTMGAVPAGTLLCGIKSWQEGSASHIDLYRSDNEGESWSYISTIASGKGPLENVHHPSFMMDASGRLLCYYSDERDPAHAQKIVYQASTDGGYTWEDPVDAIALPEQSARPGMARIARYTGNEYIMAYEYAGHPDPELDAPVYVKRSTDGITWGGAVNTPGNMVVTSDGVVANGSPSVVWTLYGSAWGRIVLTARVNDPDNPCGSEDFYNTDRGYGTWYRQQQPLPYNPAVENAGYSRDILNKLRKASRLYHINCVNFTDRNTEVWFAEAQTWYAGH